MPRIYLDHNATSPLCPEAREAMLQALHEGSGNPSSPHLDGRSARRVVESAREQVARLIGAKAEEIVLTSGGTESNNLAVYGLAGRNGFTHRALATSAIEHPSVLGPMEDLARRGASVVRVPPTREGVVEVDDFLTAAGEKAAFASLMMANNETGTLQPVAEIGDELRRRGIPFHCDATQAVGKVRVDVREIHADLLTLSGHKFGAPQGTGALYVRRGLELLPYLRGGGQELNRRPGTENVAGIAGLGAAAAAAARDLATRSACQEELRDHLEEELLRRIPGAKINGRAAPRVPNTTSVAFLQAAGEALVMALDLEGIAVSSGAACSAGTMRRSHVLEAMGLREESGASIRMSLGPATTRQEIETVLSILVRLVDRVRAAASPVGARGMV